MGRLSRQRSDLIDDANNHASTNTCARSALLLLVTDLLEHFDRVDCRHVVGCIADFAQSMNVSWSEAGAKYLPLLHEVLPDMRSAEGLPYGVNGQSGCDGCLVIGLRVPYHEVQGLLEPAGDFERL